MGLGTLRRYHKRPVEGAASETVSPPEGELELTEAETSAEVNPNDPPAEFEQIEADNADDSGDESDNGEEEDLAKLATDAGLNRNSSTADWREFAGEGFEDKSRDEIAEHFLGPKP